MDRADMAAGARVAAGAAEARAAGGRPPPRITVSLPVPPDVPATLAWARRAEAEGFDDVWFADSANADALTVAGAVGALTERVRIGTAIIPVFTRTPAVFAATALALHDIAGGRFILGLGSSSQTMMEQWNGVEFRKPLTRVRETVELVRIMLRGERTDYDGETVSSHGYRQAPLPEGAVPIYIAGLRGRMLELAGELGEGAILNLFPRQALPRMLEHVAAGAARAGASLAQREIVCRHQVLVTDDVEAARAAFRRRFVPYYATPVYNRFLAWAGFEDVAREIEQGWRSRDRARTSAAMSDELVDEIAIIGSPEHCRERVRELAAAGIDTHIIACPSEDPVDWERTIECFRPDRFSF